MIVKLHGLQNTTHCCKPGRFRADTTCGSRLRRWLPSRPSADIDSLVRVFGTCALALRSGTAEGSVSARGATQGWYLWVVAKVSVIVRKHHDRSTDCSTSSA